jgi:glycine cleavage system T protein (aminomethyltransferase)
MPNTTQLHDYHLKHAKMTEFAGYDMPLWYTTTSEEHLAVRTGSGIFDVSHMGRFSIEGRRSVDFLEALVPTSVATQPKGKAFYTLLLNDRAGIIDDLIIMRLTDDRFVLVVNAANTQTDMRHIKEHAPQDGLTIRDLTDSSAMIAVQGPGSQGTLQPLTDLDLGQVKRFRCSESDALGQRCLISRTGYTGEDGFELIIFGSTNERPDGAMGIWEKLVASSAPCGLGARDSLRLEAGFPLHGSDIDQNTDPFEADLRWVMSPGKTAYVGSESVADRISTGPPQQIRRGVVMEEGIPRHGFEVVGDSGRLGTVTSGTFSPILRKGIALCKVNYPNANFGDKVGIVVRDTARSGTLVKPPFYDEAVYGWKRRSNGN